MNISFVVPTKDRPKDLRKMLESILVQTFQPSQLVIVDSSEAPSREIVEEFKSIPIQYIHHLPPSASAQRNVGIEAVSEDADLIGFLEDDIILAPDAIKCVMNYWEKAPDDVAGCSLNIMDCPLNQSKIKTSFSSNKLGLYSKTQGVVMPTGWGTLTGTVEKDTYVEWFGGITVWRKEILEHNRFEEFFERYSYLEDLDFSYGISRNHKLVILADAKFWHFHSPSGRIGMYSFGEIEVRNRLFFVKKHNLSLSRCLLAMHVRLLMSLLQGVREMNKGPFERVAGNVVGLISSLLTMHKW